MEYSGEVLFLVKLYFHLFSIYKYYLYREYIIHKPIYFRIFGEVEYFGEVLFMMYYIFSIQVIFVYTKQVEVEYSGEVLFLEKYIDVLYTLCIGNICVY